MVLAITGLAAFVVGIKAPVVDRAAFIDLTGHNAKHAMVEQYRVIAHTLVSLTLSYRVIPGDPDFESGDLKTYDAAFLKANRSEAGISADIAASSSTSCRLLPASQTVG